MKNTARIFALTLLLAFAAMIVFWKYFALVYLPVGSAEMDTALRYISDPLANSWVSFYRGNELYGQADAERESSLSGSIWLLERTIGEYLESLEFKETREARENLETAQRELRKLKEEAFVQNKADMEEEPKEEKKANGEERESES